MKSIPYRGNAASLRRLIEAAPIVVDRRVGVVKEVFEAPKEAGGPDFFHFYAQACNTSAFAQQANFRAAGGASANRSRAVAKAIGEAVERYCAAIYDIERFPLSTSRQAKFFCVDPAAFALYNAEQYSSPKFPFVPFNWDTCVRWTSGVDLLNQEEVFVPAAMVFVPYTYYLGSGDSPICQSISTGLACHMSYAEASISAICEVIERDSVTLMWQAKMSPPQIRIETLSDDNYNLVERFEARGGKISIFDITTDNGVPSILSAVRYKSVEHPGLVIAASTALDPEEALRKSLEELAHTRRYSQQINLQMPRLVVDELHHENVSNQIDHLNFWCDHSNLRHADFLFASKTRKDFNEINNISTGDLQKDLETVGQAIAGTENRVIIVDVTAEDVRGLGFTVVRAIIPGYNRLALGFSYRARGGRRLYEVPQKLGYKGITRDSGENTFPHPYP